MYNYSLNALCCREIHPMLHPLYIKRLHIKGTLYIKRSHNSMGLVYIKQSHYIRDLVYIKQSHNIRDLCT